MTLDLRLPRRARDNEQLTTADVENKIERGFFFFFN